MCAFVGMHMVLICRATVAGFADRVAGYVRGEGEEKRGPKVRKQPRHSTFVPFYSLHDCQASPFRPILCRYPPRFFQIFLCEDGEDTRGMLPISFPRPFFRLFEGIQCLEREKERENKDDSSFTFGQEFSVSSHQKVKSGTRRLFWRQETSPPSRYWRREIGAAR